MKKITTKKRIHAGLYVMECPACGNYCASASDFDYLPEWTTCKECAAKFRIFTQNDTQLIERLTYPRFTGEISFADDVSDIENIQLIDKEIDPLIIAQAMREAGEYIKKNSNG